MSPVDFIRLYEQVIPSGIPTIGLTKSREALQHEIRNHFKLMKQHSVVQGWNLLTKRGGRFLGQAHILKIKSAYIERVD